MIEFLRPVLFELVVQYRYLAVFFALFIAGFGIPIPEELTLFVAGYLAAEGMMQPGAAFVVCYFGVLAGDVATYVLGRYGAGWVLSLGFSRWLVPPGKLARFKLSYREWGPWVLPVARLAPGLRFPSFFSAGLVHMKLYRFLIFDGLAAAVNVPIVFGLSYWFGPVVWDGIRRIIEFGDFLGTSVIVLLALLGTWWLIRRYRKTKSSP